MTLRMNLTAIGASAMLAMGVWTVAGAQDNTARATMTLSMSNGACVKTLSGNDGGTRIRAKRNANVQWTITNNCTTDATVALGDWVRKANNGASNPFDPNGKMSCSAAAGRQCVIALHVRGDAEATTYSYTTSINGTKVDPDLIIEM